MAGKNFLLLCQRIPFPPDKGDKIRSFRLLEHLQTKGQVHLGCFVDDPVDWAHVDVLEEKTASLKAVALHPLIARARSVQALAFGAPLSAPYFFSRALQKWVDQTLQDKHIDTIVIFSSAMAQYITRHNRGEARFVIDYVDVDSDKWRQYAQNKHGLARWIYGREANRLLAFDRNFGAAADCCSFVSRQDADLFKTLAPELASKTIAVSNGIDTDFFSPEATQTLHRPDSFQGDGPHLVMTGHMDYWPNVEGALWFAQTILPQVRAQFPAAQFHIVGAAPRADVKVLGESDPHIHVTGRVPDIRPYMAAADLIVAPIRIARGIQNKVLEGMAMAKCVVTTEAGFEGIEAVEGEHLLVAQDSAGFAGLIQEALRSKETEAIGQRARQHLKDHYAWAARMAGFDPYL
ncbi:MAG: TIGR03087 family PEP-CTERM/XrtA system glycosyltransferase [Alphaproteobacteria bacterium]|nr:MAG: TIGR03087 family PEP-CTERM/XrtA system glycosyltransferase [Alphaproteobacteria bacterium]